MRTSVLEWIVTGVFSGLLWLTVYLIIMLWIEGGDDD